MKSANEVDKILSLIKDSSVKSVVSLSGGGGDRKYFRLTLVNDKTVIGVVADNLKEARAFVELSQIFRDNEIPVPEVYGYSEDFKYYIEEDLGDNSLFDSIKNERDVSEQIKETMQILARMQCAPEHVWSSKTAYAPFSRRQVMWDLNYFKYEFVKPCAVAFDENLLEDDFERLASSLLSIPECLQGFQMRDCQSRNIMLHPGPYFIDYQSGRKGPCIYDAISFLWQAKAGFSNDFRREMLDVYASEFAKIRGVRKTEILKFADRFALFRTLQVLGAYGFRGLVEKRAHFIESIPGALKNLDDLISSGSLDDYHELKRVCVSLIADPRFKIEKKDTLQVKVFSFSYKKGYPEDLSGNGGGFMFDCRGMHNPGRYEEYKQLTGRDKPVKDFLTERGEADKFAENALSIVRPSVERYLSRGFDSLQIGFGCTGGQHRSVYCAEKIAHTLKKEFPKAQVILMHREQNIKEIL